MHSAIISPSISEKQIREPYFSDHKTMGLAKRKIGHAQEMNGSPSAAQSALTHSVNGHRINGIRSVTAIIRLNTGAGPK